IACTDRRERGADRSRTMTDAKPIKQKRSPRPPRPRPPLNVAEQVRQAGIDPEKMFDLDAELQVGIYAVVDGKGYIQAKLDNGEIDAATAAELAQQVEIDAKAVARTGDARIDAKLAEIELGWKEMGRAPPAEVWAYLHYNAGNLPPEALKT